MLSYICGNSCQWPWTLVEHSSDLMTSGWSLQLPIHWWDCFCDELYLMSRWGSLAKYQIILRTNLKNACIQSPIMTNVQPGPGRFNLSAALNMKFRGSMSEQCLGQISVHTWNVQLDDDHMMMFVWSYNNEHMIMIIWSSWRPSSIFELPELWWHSEVYHVWSRNAKRCCKTYTQVKCRPSSLTFYSVNYWAVCKHVHVKVRTQSTMSNLQQCCHETPVCQLQDIKWHEINRVPEMACMYEYELTISAMLACRVEPNWEAKDP